MTVGELITRLSAYDRNYLVVCQDYEEGYYGVTAVDYMTATEAGSESVLIR